MSEATYSAGPWYIEVVDGDLVTLRENDEPTFLSEKGTFSVRCERGTIALLPFAPQLEVQEQIKNARAIVCLPDLIGFVEEMARVHDRHCHKGMGISRHCGCQVAKAQAILARAKGGGPESQLNEEEAGNV